jgi:hypothetical protein
VEFEGGPMIDWQMTYNGLTFGASTVYGIQSMSGLHDLPEVRTSDRARARTHGQFQGSDYLGGRDIDVSVTITSKHPSNAIWQAFSQALVAGQVDELPLTIQVPGVGLGGEIQVGARVRKLSLPISMDYYKGVGRANVQFHCTDPRMYSSTLQSVNFTQATTSGGLSFNATFNLSFGGAATGGTATCTNGGEFPSPWEATITGPIVDPRIENVNTGQIIYFIGTLAAGETLVVGTQDRTVLLNGTASRYSWIKQGTQWFDLAPGDNTMRLAGASGTGTMAVNFRSAWI